MSIKVQRTGDTGAPQAGITVDGLSTATPSTVTLTVSWDGGAVWHPVRGGSVKGALGTCFVRDFVTPLGVTAVYRAVVTGGTTATWEAASLIPADGLMWLQDPLDPHSAIPVAASADIPGVLTLLSPSLGSFRRPQKEDTALPFGASLPVSSLGMRLAPVDIPLAIRGIASSQSDLLRAFRGLLETAGQLVLRGIPQGVPLPPVVHVTAEVSDSSQTNTHDAYQIIELSVSPRQPVAVSIVIPWWTYGQVNTLIHSQLSANATYAQVKAAMTTGKTYTQWSASPGVLS